MSNTVLHSVEKREIHSYYSAWHLDMQILFKFFQSQNQFALDWLNLKWSHSYFALYILPRMQNKIDYISGSVSPEQTGSETGKIWIKFAWLDVKHCNKKLCEKTQKFRQIDWNIIKTTLQNLEWQEFRQIGCKVT